MDNFVSQRRPAAIVNLLSSSQNGEMIDDIRRGMTRESKSIPSKYFYDSHGSLLFEQICSTSEYYVTETELSILDEYSEQIMSFFVQQSGDLIELGSGSPKKIRKLFDALNPYFHKNIRYIPVDICEEAISQSLTELSYSYPNLEALGIVADFTGRQDMLPTGRKLITFFGGTIGNFEQEECARFLKSLREVMNPEDRFLLGLDMIKPVEILESAYNDAEGVTREFNLNILSNINRQLRANFDLANFEHVAFFNREHERIEMHLRAKRSAMYYIADIPLYVDLTEGETIHTEISRKFTRKSAQKQFKAAGLSVTRWHTDAKSWFSLVELKKAANIK
jgi:L-histidine N-alpha-methyltransferase